MTEWTCRQFLEQIIQSHEKYLRLCVLSNLSLYSDPVTKQHWKNHLSEMQILHQ